MSESAAGLGSLAELALALSPILLKCGNETYVKKTTSLKSCSKPGKHSCPDCGLVTYCTVDCMREHWPTHKLICEAPYCSDNWASAMPKLGSVFHEDVPLRRFLWGNVPAFDVLNLRDNEGESYNESLNLLFAACGDLRNVVSTVNTLPIGYDHLCEVVINDMDADVIIRNAIILLIIYTFPDRAEAVTAIIHLWYSVAMPAELWNQISDRLGVLVNEFYVTIKQKKSSTQASKSWTFGSGAVFLTLSRKDWKRFVEILGRSASLDYTAMMTARAIKLGGDKGTYIHEVKLLTMPTYLRGPETRFRQTGILLPFGEPVSTYETINPTFFNEDGEYMMLSGESPLDGWSLAILLESCRKFGLPENDLYGSLYHHVSSILLTFSYRISNLKLNFHLYSRDEQQLDGALGNSNKSHANGLLFDRIEVASIADEVFLGFEKTVRTFGRRLKPRSQNKYATLVLLHLGTFLDEKGPKETDEEKTKTSLITVDMIKAVHSRGKQKEVLMLFIQVMHLYFIEHEVLWKRFEEQARCTHWGSVAGLEMKPGNTIIEPWPFRLKADNDLEAMKKQIRMLLAQQLHSGERYVEWVRKA